MPMVQTRSIIAFRWLLPISQLAICAIALWPSRAALIEQIMVSTASYQRHGNPLPNLPAGEQIILDPNWEKNLAEFDRLERRELIPVALNLPCGLAQLPYVIVSPSKQDWTLGGVDVRAWRAITWPVVGCLFWWIAGRGIEGMVAAQRHLIYPPITWIETIAFAALCVFCIVAAVGVPLFSGHQDDDFPMKLFVAAFGMWAVLGGIVVGARLAQWRIQKRTTFIGVSDASSA
jgi:hypothetical protein